LLRIATFFLLAHLHPVASLPTRSMTMVLYSSVYTSEVSVGWKQHLTVPAVLYRELAQIRSFASRATRSYHASHDHATSLPLRHLQNSTECRHTVVLIRTTSDHCHGHHEFQRRTTGTTLVASTQKQRSRPRVPTGSVICVAAISR
jgi:hypothetical protein